MKLSRKLFSATAALGLAVLATVGSTYAWFSVNDTVTVTGMTATTKVSSNLLISETNAEASFQAPSLPQARTGLLEPVSTINGEDFFYTVNAKANGAAKTAEYVAYNESAFRTAYKQNTAVGYIDYDFYLKAISTQDQVDILAMTECNLLYNNNPITTEKAWRVALFAEVVSAGVSKSAAEVAVEGNLVTILALSGATNQTPGKAVDSTNSVDTVTYGTPAVIDNTFTSDAETKYYKVVVRLWLEGEDNTCTNETFAALTNNYALSLEFQIGTSANVTPNVVSIISSTNS